VNTIIAAPPSAESLWRETARRISAEEMRRARNYPLSRWYLRPLAGLVARRLARSTVRPWQVTVTGFATTLLASLTIVLAPKVPMLAGSLILFAWFCDRLDGQLARRQGTASRFGAWLDGNLDELGDLTLHTAFAYAASTTLGAFAWMLWGLFVTGKYLFMYGLSTETAGPESDSNPSDSNEGANSLRWLYHLPANADVRIHLAAAAAYLGYWGVELGLIAVYYQLRWLARYVLVARRLRGGAT
jgi:hypothetical protein